MKKVLHSIILLVFCLLAIQVNAKTVYYVKSGATGNGSSWNNASGSIQAMIDQASPGDEVWIAGGTYVTPSTDKNYDEPIYYYFNLKLGVSIFGGFKGIESNLQQREKKDRNRNGTIEPWEFAHETILSGYYGGEKIQWKVDDENNILEIVSDVEKSSLNILQYYQNEIVSSYPFETYVSGFTLTGGKSACVIHSSECFVISDCEICYNRSNNLSILYFNDLGELDSKSCIKNSTIHHNFGSVAWNGNSIENSLIHHNHFQNRLIYYIKYLNYNKIYANVQSQGKEDCIMVNTCHSCEIYKNQTYVDTYYSVTSIVCDTIYNSDIYENSGNGARAISAYDCNFYHNKNGGEVATAYNCNFYQNERDGGYVATAYNCKFYENKGTGVYIGPRAINGLYIDDKGLVDCEIYKNEKKGVDSNNASLLLKCNIYNNKGCGITESTAYNCHIYGNEDGGASASDLYDCIIENNTTEGDGGGTRACFLQNCIIRNNFAVGNGGGCDGGDLKNCKIYNNEALNDGGGVFDATIWGCSIFNNKAGDEGGGVYGDNYHAHCYNSEIYNNYASLLGGIGGAAYYDNCTIVHNKSFSGSENKGQLRNCIMVGSFDGNASYSALTDSYISGTGNFMATEKELKFVKSTSFIGNASNEKSLEELKNADFRLSKGSFAIDMGEHKLGTILPIEDMSGYPRPMGEKTDIGAHEYLSFRALPYENKFNENYFPMSISGRWKNGNLPGKDGDYLYYEGEASVEGYDLGYVTTTFFDKAVSNKINLSFDVASKYRTKDQQEKMHIILAYLESEKIDTIMTFSNKDYVQDLHFSKEISSWVSNKVFRVIFAIEASYNPENNYKANTVYCGISNLKISKQDASVEIIAEDKVCRYDGKSHAIDFQINDTRVDKNKVIVTYQKEGETTAVTTPPTNAGVYQVRIAIEDGSYFGMKDVKLTIEKAYQTIQWSQQLRTMKAKEKIQLEATATSGLPVSFSSEDETIAKVEMINGKWWLVADTLSGEVTVKAAQSGNENYNLANSVLKTIRVEPVPTGISDITTDKATAYFVKAENCISVRNIYPDSQLYLYDSSGHLCIVKKADNTEMQIPVHELSKGVYYLLIINRNEKENFKILIN